MAETKPRKTPERNARGAERRTKFTSFRFTQAEYDQILALAQKRDMNMTEYVTRAALGTLHLEPVEMQRRLEDHEKRLRDLERLAELGALG